VFAIACGYVGAETPFTPAQEDCELSRAPNARL
jgi:hypothetical protein